MQNVNAKFHTQENNAASSLFAEFGCFEGAEQFLPTLPAALVIQQNMLYVFPMGPLAG